ALTTKKTAADRAAAVRGLLASQTLGSAPPSNIERWGLHEYIEVALDLGVISAAAAGQARLAKDFRNLVHPGRAARLGMVCDRGTALTALAAVELVVRDLS